MNAKALAHLRKSDRTLARWIERIGPMTLEAKTRQSPFAALSRSIVYQQLTGKAAGTIHGRVKDLFPRRGFPNPELFLQMPEASFRSAGLSRNKTAALKDLAAKTLEGVVPPHREIVKMSDDEIIERLCAVRGVGRWTVEMMLIFKLARADVLPATDYGVRKGFAKVYRREELPSPKELLAFGERWKPYRSVAAWYLWRALDI